MKFLFATRIVATASSTTMRRRRTNKRAILSLPFVTTIAAAAAAAVLLLLPPTCNAGLMGASLSPHYRKQQELEQQKKQKREEETSDLPPHFFDLSQDIREFLNPALLENPATMEAIGDELSEGNVVVIRNAFHPHLAEAAHRELQAADFSIDQDFHASGSHHSFHKLDKDSLHTAGAVPIVSTGDDDDGDSTSTANTPPTNSIHNVLDSMMGLFNSNDTKNWMSTLSGRDCMGEATARGEMYVKGDHSLPITDFIYQRTVAFDWHLTKNWEPEWGGALYWVQEAQEHAYIHPSFNTLILYSVTKDTSHFVTPVTHSGTTATATTTATPAKRLSLTGWWNSAWIPKKTDNYEEILPKWKDNMTEFQYMAINFVITSDSFDQNRRQVVEPLLWEVQDSQFRGHEGSYEFGQLIPDDNNNEDDWDDDEEEEDEWDGEEWEDEDYTEGDL